MPGSASLKRRFVRVDGSLGSGRRDTRRDPEPGTQCRRRQPACGAAIALSAFLLFILEPMVGLGVLPVFGGVPATWATVLCFFQGVLVLGVPATATSPSRGWELDRARSCTWASRRVPWW